MQVLYVMSLIGIIGSLNKVYISFYRIVQDAISAQVRIIKVIAIYHMLSTSHTNKRTYHGNGHGNNIRH
jgi:hypothetical protein